MGNKISNDDFSKAVEIIKNAFQAEEANIKSIDSISFTIDGERKEYHLQKEDSSEKGLAEKKTGNEALAAKHCVRMPDGSVWCF